MAINEPDDLPRGSASYSPPPLFGLPPVYDGPIETPAGPSHVTVPGIGNIRYWELAPHSPQEGYANKSLAVKRSFLVDWTLRWSFCYGMLGYSYVENASDGGGEGANVLRRVLPQPYKEIERWVGAQPPAPGEEQYWGDDKYAVFPVHVECIEGVSPGRARAYESHPASSTYVPAKRVYKRQLTGVGQFEYAKVTLAYEAVLYRVRRDDDPRVAVGGYSNSQPLWNGKQEWKRFVTRIVEPTAEFLTLPTGSMKFVPRPNDPAQPNPVPVLGSNGRIVPATQITYVWHQIPLIPQGAYTQIGTVNKEEFDGYPAETLLLAGVDVKPHTHVGGERYYDICYKFKYIKNYDDEGSIPANHRIQDQTGFPASEKYAGHNHFLHPVTMENLPGASGPKLVFRYDRITTNGKGPLSPEPDRGTPPFRSSDFRLLFVPVRHPDAPRDL